MRTWLRRSLWDLVPRDQRDTPAGLRRRQVVAVATVVAGAVLLGVSLRIEPGSVAFYPATFALAAVWVAGALASGRLHLGRIAVRDQLRRPVLAPLLVGAGLAAVFLVAALVLRPVPFVADQVRGVLDHAAEGSLTLVAVVTVVNGIAEELFFRGAVYAAVPRRPVLVSTVAYTLTTIAAGNLLLVVAALLLGLVVGLERRASGGILGPAITHVTWALLMLFGLPLVF
ncbi:CPBP family glutamic-type intramembrane protease [Nocardioides jiangxiensis]|uniref:CPBP family glutamic-type intramembrane protease n=1 Tax=Nocardioides jiangxiensis TaxID=3064524 RepID=A0ABT9B4I0_9ACTN|nr:CPBP family glutamic-type intramembrane protease [Nocardioides sp. WY-20]MDO7868068.1 CPBP family glutamic-type intramembrane protease [Nocardioides sp. WY-20]